MRKTIHILFLGFLFTLSSVTQTVYHIDESNIAEFVQIAQEGSESASQKSHLYDPIVPYSGEVGFSNTSIVPEPVVSEKLTDELSGKDIHENRTEENNKSLLLTSNQLVRSLSVKKLIFPFHSFL
ncbi:MAG: hypothetical protein ABJR05_10775 [Balneola sp.]